MRLPMLASMIHLWATIRGISFPVTNSLDLLLRNPNWCMVMPNSDVVILGEFDLTGPDGSMDQQSDPNDLSVLPVKSCKHWCSLCLSEPLASTCLESLVWTIAHAQYPVTVCNE
jgi:hypothetical protein